MTTTRLHRVRTIGRGLLYTVAVLAGLSQPALGQQADPRREPATAIVEAIRLLERKDYVTYFKTFVRPSEAEELLAKKNIEVLVAEFAEKRAADILTALREAARMTLTLNAEGTRATYRLEKPIGRESRVSLEKIGDFWFFR